ncbi:MAG: DUF59 domain-containing protein [Elusimicrobia bacterium]|nr:DUF59 domain-containing protein [Elusimicrobiota bacterium]
MPTAIAPAQKDIAAALYAVEDPEIHQSVIDLGLIYGIEIHDGGKVNILMTMTTPMCPYAPMLQEMARKAASEVKGVTETKVQLVWDPAWDPHKMCSEEAKINLGLIW